MSIVQVLIGINVNELSAKMEYPRKKACKYFTCNQTKLQLFLSGIAANNIQLLTYM